MSRFASACLAFTLLLPGAAAAQEGSFSAWLADFRPRLAASGASPQTVAAMLDGLEPLPVVIERDRDQPEFVRPLWQYLEGAASDQRVADGLAARDRTPALGPISAHYGVSDDILVAIWGLESAYGRIQGDHDVVRALATLAWEGRRRSWAEAQLIATAQIIDRGWATRAQLRGSWAGAMGQTQFIPETFVNRAQDWDGDGRRDIWGHEGDALASAANLLARAGWESGAPVAIEVTLPDGFSLESWSPDYQRAVGEWAQIGLTRADGAGFADENLLRPARLILPTGARGPAFLALRNFQALRRYNNSTAYILGVWLLSERLAGRETVRAAWPTDDPPITRSQTIELQQGLIVLGYDPGAPDGIFGPNTSAALRAFQRDNGHAADGYAGLVMYEAVRAAVR